MTLRVTIAIFFCAGAFLPARILARDPGLSFNEIMYALPGKDAGREWIELVNLGQEPITLVGGGVKEKNAWKLVIKSGDAQETHRFAPQPLTGSLTVEPGGYLVIAVDALAFLQEHPLFRGTVVDCCGQSASANPLRDTAGLLELKNGAGEVVSEAYYSNILGAWENGKTLEFDGSLWREGLREGGTPAQENSVIGLLLPPPPSPVPPASPSPAPSPVLANTSSLSAEPRAASSGNGEAHRDLLKYLVVSEFLPNPPGDDRAGEWIEIANVGNEPIPLQGVALATASTKNPYRLKGSLDAGGYALIRREESGLVLRNSGGEVKLLDDDKVFFSISYESEIPEGWSAARFGESWKITKSPTPGAANAWTEEMAETADASDIREGATEEPPRGEEAASGAHSPAASPASLLAAGLFIGAASAAAAIFLKRRVS